MLDLSFDILDVSDIRAPNTDLSCVFERHFLITMCESPSRITFVQPYSKTNLAACRHAIAFAAKAEAIPACTIEQDTRIDPPAFLATIEKENLWV